MLRYEKVSEVNNMNNLIIEEHSIQNKIFTVRGLQVMLDADLAELYGVETKQLNKAVNRNLDRFPESFRFQLTQQEFNDLRFHFGTSSEHGGIFYDGQIFDAYVFVSELIKSAKNNIVLFDNYVDESVLILLSKRVSTCRDKKV